MLWTYIFYIWAKDKGKGRMVACGTHIYMGVHNMDPHINMGKGKGKREYGSVRHPYIKYVGPCYGPTYFIYGQKTKEKGGW